MRYVAAALGLSLGVWPAVAFAQTPPEAGASAAVRDPAGRLVASATFRETPDQMLIDLTFPDRTLSGTHGLQIHENGRCDPPDFATAGGIFNPFGKQHGLLNPEGPMAGDLPSLVMGPSGLTQYNTVAPLVNLSQGPAALLRAGGTSLVIYAQGDDDQTQPDGGAGARIACGVILPAQPSAASSAPILPGSQSPATDSRPAPTGALIIAVGGLLLIAAGVALRHRRRRL